MLEKFHVKEYEKPHVHNLKKRKHKGNHQIKEQTQFHKIFHPVWVTSMGLVSRVGRSLH